MSWTIISARCATELANGSRDAFEAAGEGLGIANIRARLACATVVDKDGRRMFEDSDADQLGAKSSKAVGRVFDVAAPLNGLSAQDVEELAGN